MAVARDEIEFVLDRCLKGQWLAEASLGGDVTVLRFSNGLHLLCQRLRGERDDEIREALSALGDTVRDGVEPDEVQVGVNLGRNARRAVQGVSVLPTGALKLTFDGGWSVVATTDTDIVDWQWSVGRVPLDPYVAPTIAYFAFALDVGGLFDQFAEPGSPAERDRNAGGR
ncbi:MAG: hypothetical protein AAF211_04585 [Myxococcota bacterium]